MELVIFEEDRPFVLAALREGEFDYMEAASELFEADFFRFIKARTYLWMIWPRPTPSPEEGGSAFVVLCGAEILPVSAMTGEGIEIPYLTAVTIEEFKEHPE